MFHIHPLVAPILDHIESKQIILFSAALKGQTHSHIT